MELTDGLGQVEVTAHVDLAEMGEGGAGDSARHGFPSLFRRDDPSGEPKSSDDEGVTVS